MLCLLHSSGQIATATSEMTVKVCHYTFQAARCPYSTTPASAYGTRWERTNKVKFPPIVCILLRCVCAFTHTDMMFKERLSRAPNYCCRKSTRFSSEIHLLLSLLKHGVCIRCASEGSCVQRKQPLLDKALVQHTRIWHASLSYTLLPQQQLCVTSVFVR